MKESIVSYHAVVVIMKIEPTPNPWHALPDEQQWAWYGFLRTHTVLIKLLDADLQATYGLTLSAYDVLVQLSQAPKHQLQMSELADVVLLSQSGLTRLVERLEREGLVLRQRGETDARTIFTIITERGLEKLAAMHATHIEGVRARFLDRLSAAQLEELACVWRQLLALPDKSD